MNAREDLQRLVTVLRAAINAIEAAALSEREASIYARHLSLPSAILGQAIMEAAEAAQKVSASN